MKRKYAAWMLGLALAVTSVNVFATATKETEIAQMETERDAEAASEADIETNTEKATEQAEAMMTTNMWGKVASVVDGKLTIELAELKEKTKDDDAEEAHEGHEINEDEIAIPGADYYTDIFSYSTAEQSVTLTEETNVQLIYQDADAKKMQKLAEEYTKLKGEKPADKKTEKEPIVADLSIDAIIKGDLVYVSMDVQEHAVSVLVFMPEDFGTDLASEQTATDLTETEQ